MNTYDRMKAFFDQTDSDRLPVTEWAPWWHLTVQRWQGEGLDDLIAPSLPYVRERGLDYGEAMQHALGLDMMRQFYISNYRKRPESTHPDGVLLKDESDYVKLKEYLFPYENIPKMRAAFESLYEKANGECVIWSTFEGWFWFPRTLFGIEAHFYSFYDYPELYLELCRDMTSYYCAVADEVFVKYQPSFITLAEDMSYNLGSMLSKECFDTFIAPFYREFAPRLHDKGIKMIIDSDGDITEMIPWLMESGADGILPLERQAGVDISMLSEKYPEFYFLGGFDKMCMKFGREAMEAEFIRLLPAIKRRKLVPGCDHQTPPDVPLETYKIYTELLAKYCSM